MATEPSLFFTELLHRHPEWCLLPIVERAGHGWRGLALIVPPPLGTDLVCGLDIEEVQDEITVGFDHAHTHLLWEPRSEAASEFLWRDPWQLVDAILNEKVLSLSGWIGGELRIGSLRQVGQPFDLLVPNIEHLRVRSWHGNFDRDERRDSP